MWTVGCMLAEMVAGVQIFAAEDSTSQLLRVFQMLGFPSRADLYYLGKRYDTLVVPPRPSGGNLVSVRSGCFCYYDVRGP